MLQLQQGQATRLAPLAVGGAAAAISDHTSKMLNRMADVRFTFNRRQPETVVPQLFCPADCFFFAAVASLSSFMYFVGSALNFFRQFLQQSFTT